MKVFVVLEGYNYEGYGKPPGIFSTHELAQSYIDREIAKGIYGPDSRDIVEYEIDVVNP